MSTPTCVAIFEEPIPDKVVDRAEELFDAENIFSLSNTVMLLRVYLEAPNSLKNVLYLTEGANAGVVFKLNGSYSGYHDEELWDWLKAGL